MQKGDVHKTHANITKLKMGLELRSILLEEGIKRYIKWLREYITKLFKL